MNFRMWKRIKNYNPNPWSINSTQGTNEDPSSTTLEHLRCRWSYRNLHEVKTSPCSQTRSQHDCLSTHNTELDHLWQQRSSCSTSYHREKESEALVNLHPLFLPSSASCPWIHTPSPHKFEIANSVSPRKPFILFYFSYYYYFLFPPPLGLMTGRTGANWRFLQTSFVVHVATIEKKKIPCEGRGTTTYGRYM